ncbi:hypothetical protein CC78DRAFT_579701 [Lojkania enalia]|uniref:Rhodopsin domain-containing protein n=1 Tax=Lojkania enalia TaxID=147567 RepID=A0A9P4KCA3_9PLEO|nr:hypothetical protein CC78DRAFT_579701 [Didymosphaeria enalia]
MRPLPHNTIGITVISSCTVGIVVDLIFIGLRLWGRKLKRKQWVASDYLVIAAWILLLADLIRRGIGYSWGVGLHTSEIVAAQGNGRIENIQQLTYSGTFLWIATACITKFSILLIYLEVFYCVTWFLWAIRITMGIVVCFFLVAFVGLMITCKPFEANWNPMLPGADCSMTQGETYVFSGAFNLGLDIILVLLPIPVIWSMSNLTKRKRVAVCAMFALGFLIIFVVSIRFKLIPHRDIYDIPHDGEIPGLLTEVEVYLGIVSACLPFLSPALAEMKGAVTSIVSGSMSHDSGSRGSSRDAKESPTSPKVGDSDQSLAKHSTRYRREDEEMIIGNDLSLEPWQSGKGSEIWSGDAKMISEWNVRVGVAH